MTLIWIIAIIFVLYLRTLNYFYLIDDYVPRHEYLWNVPTESVDPAKFYIKKPHWSYRLFMIAMHVVNTSIIYLLWGWAPALLFAVHPMSAWATCWVTGNYYGTTAYFILIAYYILHTFPTWWGAAIALPIYLSALNSTVGSLTFPFLAMFMPWGWTMFFPLIAFLNGKRFRAGLKTRLDIIQGSKIEDTKFTFRRLLFMTKVMARYIYFFFVPMKVFYFGLWHERIRNYRTAWDDAHSANKEFWVSFALCAVVFAGGMLISPIGTLWFFILMAVHSQFNVLGQTFAQRYLYLPMIGLCVVAGTLLQPYPLIVIAIAGFLACKTHYVIPNWRNMEDLLKNEINMNPDRGATFSMVAQYYMAVKPLHSHPFYMINYISYLMRRSISLAPEIWTVRLNYAAYLTQIGRLDESIAETRETLRLLKEFGTTRETPIFDNVRNQEKRLLELREKAIMDMNNQQVEMRRQADLKNRKERRDENKKEKK